MKRKVPTKHYFLAPITETKQYKSISVVGNEESKKENYHHNKKKKTQRKLRSICNDKGTVKEKSIRHSLSSIMRWRGRMISEGVTIVVGTVDSLSEELVSCVVGMHG